jgi:O-antigen/teichoic acid export membrane protein
MAIAGLNFAFPFLILGYAARLLGPETMGRFAVMNALVTFFIFAAGLGLPIYGMREIGNRRGNPDATHRLIGALFRLGALSATAATLVYALVVAFTPHLRADWLVGLLLGFGIPLTAIALDYVAYGEEKPAGTVLRTVLAKSTILAFTVATVHGPEDLLWFGLAQSLGFLVQHGLAFFAITRTYSLRISDPLMAHATQLPLLVLGVALANLYVTLDAFFLSFWLPPDQVAFYNAAIRPIRILAGVITSLGFAVLPRMAHYRRQASSGDESLLFRRTLQAGYLFGLPAALLIGIFSPLWIRILFGPEFAPAAKALTSLAPMLVVAIWVQAFGVQRLFAQGRTGALAACSGIAAALSIGLNAILAPRLGLDGAVISALIAETGALGSLFWFLRKEKPWRALKTW